MLSKKAPVTHIFLSPHLDDAIACCGGTIASHILCGDEVVIFNVFSGLVDAPYSSAALELHEMWGNPPNIVLLRRAEDQAAAARLGATSTFSEIPEALYRKDHEGNWLYGEEDAIFGALSSADAWLSQHVQEVVEQTISEKPTKIYAPLAIGNHVDHIIVNKAGVNLAKTNLPVIFYEDFPYVLDHQFTQKDSYKSFLQQFGTACLKLKIEAFSYYRSQIPMLFSTVAQMKQQFTNYSQRVGNGNFVERYWILKDTQL